MNLANRSEYIESSIEGHILRIAMNRPEKKNALTPPMYDGMAELIIQARQSKDIRVIYLTGTQDCFSSGNDLSSFAGERVSDQDGTAPLRFLKALIYCEKPVVAAVNGAAVGIGTTMLLHCDMVIAGEDSRFQLPFAKLGVCPEAASSYTLPLRIGYHRAAEMLMLGDVISAVQAAQWGLVNAVYPNAEYQQQALVVAERLAQQPPSSIQTTKKLIREPLLRAIEEAMERENLAFAECLASPESKQAIAAFMAGRPADISRQ